jgi:hypothetical protein
MQQSGKSVLAAGVGKLSFDPLTGVDFVLIDGHQMGLGVAIAKRAQAKQIPVWWMEAAGSQALRRF